MLRPRGRPGRLLAYFDDISGSAVSTGLPVALLPTEVSPGSLPSSLSFTRICIISFNYYQLRSAFNGSTAGIVSGRNCWKRRDVNDGSIVKLLVLRLGGGGAGMAGGVGGG